MKLCSSVRSVSVFLCSIHFLSTWEGVATENLLPQWQFDETSRWTKFKSEIYRERWTDGRHVKVAECREERHTKCYDCWSVSDFIKISSKKAYEFSIYIKSTGKDMHNYFGFYVYDKKQIQITNGKWKNPYFKSSANDPNQWTKWTAYILPHEMFDHDKDGIANGQSFHTNGIDWIWTLPS
ncbi:uncharacterized protein LOC134196085 [Corticium candelabrum]|uniref:uncharacterized protein LOC134196085 n=1 Tax=Corticium candelabrum TaxID=121492 RepID=UPI002E26D9C6|nr:uncharacterized protein LOC134196085 [Corticium candelabrum]